MLWCGAEDDDGGPQENSEIKVERVVEALQGGRKPGFVQIADELDKVPWECAGGLAEPRSSRRARRGLGQAARDFVRERLSSWSCSSIGFTARRAGVSVVSCLEANDGARDAAPRADSAAARAGQHVMAAAIVPAHQIGLDGSLTEYHCHRILNVSWRDIPMRIDLP